MAKRAQMQLLRDFGDLKKNPVGGFSVDLPNDNDMFTWEVYVQGPTDTIYEGAAFRALLRFPSDFPYTPPKMIFTSEVWHPNVYWGGKKAGEVCISILHPPGGSPDAPDECESDAERWNPAHSVTTIILSVISMLSDPNFSSPANVDASVQWRNDLEKFKERVRQTVVKSHRELPPGFEFPKEKKYVPETLVLFNPDEDDDSDYESCNESHRPSNGLTQSQDSLFQELEGMGFERDQIISAIKTLQDAGKKVHQESVMEKLIEE
eukprot:TRINITY_DN3537_c0_g1_i1.p1 TRINITY_DN3537_c0_g1~~TRINITY_DN3537_c0_g1_i1.p1  ORF type:complete len:282 (+),score=79.66 TRINITY_DN3537_c0_g1_i1:55-846(+)